MRESIGGTWLLGFVVLFIVLFSAYLAYSINYTKAFKTKNFIINTIEENEGFSECDGCNFEQFQDSDYAEHHDTESKIYYYLKNIGYATQTIDKSKCSDEDDYKEGGYCVRTISTSSGGIYYKVTTFINIEIPLIWQTFTIPIKGETKVIYNANNNNNK